MESGVLRQELGEITHVYGAMPKFMCVLKRSSIMDRNSPIGSYKRFIMLYCLPVQWQEVICGFRAGMPRRRKRIKMRCYDNCFTGSEAVEWLLGYMQTTGLFGLVSRQQVSYLFHPHQERQRHI